MQIQSGHNVLLIPFLVFFFQYHTKESLIFELLSSIFVFLIYIFIFNDIHNVLLISFLVFFLISYKRIIDLRTIKFNICIFNLYIYIQ